MNVFKKILSRLFPADQTSSRAPSTSHTETLRPASAPAILEMLNTAHPECFAARTHRGWGVVDRDGVWRIPDRYAEIGEVRHVTIDFESVAITLYNEDRWVAAVRPEAGGLWGGIKLEKRPGEEVTQFIFESEAAVFVCVTGS